MGARQRSQRAARILHPVRHRLLPWVLVAAAVGIAVPVVSTSIAFLVPLFLAGQVFGVAVNLTPAELRAAARRWKLVLGALAVQWTVLPGLGFLLHAIAPGHLMAAGILICAISPSEITSPLMATLAGGDAAVATTCMAGSLALSTGLVPLWLQLGFRGAGQYSPIHLASELALSVLVPLVIGVAVRSRFPAVARWRHHFLDFSASCLVLVVLAGVGQARGVLLSTEVVPVALLSAALLVGGGAAGWGLGRVLGLGHGLARAVGFPVAIREFGVAIAVALAVAPPAAAVGGIYGILMVGGAGTLASRMGRRSRAEARRARAQR